MNRALSFLLILLATASLLKASAQAPQPDENDRQKWFSEVRNFKHDFLAKELDLTKEQQRDFYAAYDEMEDRINRLNSETRDLEQRTISDEQATDVQLDAAARAMYQLKSEEGKIELEYYDRFRSILQPRQMLRLKNAERKFTQQLMIHHRRLKNADNGRKRQ